MKFNSYIICFFLSGLICFAQKEKADNISLPPVLTFEENCARCHGSEGDNFGDHFTKLKNDELRNITEEMMYGPGFLNPTETEINAMTAYQTAISKNEPFAVVLNAGSYLNGVDEILKVEVSSGSKPVENDSYTIEKGSKVNRYLIKSISKDKVEISVTKNGKAAGFIFPENIRTH